MDNDFLNLSRDAKAQITSQKNALVEYFTKAEGEEVFGSAYTLIIYQRVYDLLMSDPEFQTTKIMNLILADDPPIIGELTKYCLDKNVMDLNNIRDLCLEHLNEM